MSEFMGESFTGTVPGSNPDTSGDSRSRPELLQQASQANAFDRTGPSIFARDPAFIGASVGGIGLAQAVKQHNARPQLAANISTEPADRLARPRRKGRALV